MLRFLCFGGDFSPEKSASDLEGDIRKPRKRSPELKMQVFYCNFSKKSDSRPSLVANFQFLELGNLQVNLVQ